MEFKIGDKVRYLGEDTVVVLVNNGGNYTVEYSEGWEGDDNGLSAHKKYHYADEEELTAIEKSKALTEYYEYTDQSKGDFTKGKIYKCIDPSNLKNSFNFIDDRGTPNGWGSSNYTLFKPSTKEAYDAQNKSKELSKAELLKIAKEKYPVGTKIKGIINDNGIIKFNSKVETVKGDWYWAEGSDCPSCKTNDGYAALYGKGIWAEIIEQPKPQYQNLLDIEVGDVVRCNSTWESKFATREPNGWQKDLEFTVSSVVKYGDHNIYFGGAGTHGVFSDNIILVKKKNSKEDFKVGDWICTIFTGGNDTCHIEHRKSYENPGELIQIDHFSLSSTTGGRVAVSKEGHVLYVEEYPHYFRKATKEEIASVTRTGFKVGDWVYAGYETSDKDALDFRDDEYIPIFQVKELNKQGSRVLLRPEKGISTGVEDKLCRLATFEEIRSVTKEYVPEHFVPQLRYVWGIDPTPKAPTPSLKPQLTLSIEDDEDLPMVRPKRMVKITNKLTID
jgi:hypothetical protein